MTPDRIILTSANLDSILAGAAQELSSRGSVTRDFGVQDVLSLGREAIAKSGESHELRSAMFGHDRENPTLTVNLDGHEITLENDPKYSNFPDTQRRLRVHGLAMRAAASVALQGKDLNDLFSQLVKDRLGQARQVGLQLLPDALRVSVAI